MSLDTAAARPRPRRRWLLAAVLAAAVALPVIAFALTRLGGGDLPDGLRRELAARAEAILESSAVIADTGDAGHDHGGQRRVLCTVDPFGIDPAGARGVAEVRWVYAQHLCALGEPGTPWDFASKTAGPVAVALTNPPQVRLPLPPGDYRTQVRQLFPARYLTQAFGTFAHPDQVAQLRQRFTDQVSHASPAPTGPAR